MVTAASFLTDALFDRAFRISRFGLRGGRSKRFLVNGSLKVFRGLFTCGPRRDVERAPDALT